MKEYIIITGASSGIGQALAIEFANKGYNVLAIGRNEVGLYHRDCASHTN